MNKYSLIIDFSTKLDHAQNFYECFDILTQAAESLGFDGALYMYMPIFFADPKVNFSPIMQISSRYGTNYVKHYHEHQFIEHDHMIQVAVNGENRLINWFEDVEILPLSNRSIEVLETARYFGIRNGFSFPTFLSEQIFAAASFICRKNDAFFMEICQPNIQLMRALTNIFHAKVILEKHYQKIFITPFVNQLTPTKISILEGLRTGKNIKTIAHELDVSNKYIQNLMSDIRHDFGDVSRDRLMYLLGAIDLVD